MKQKILHTLLYSLSFYAAGAQTIFDDKGLQDNIALPQWTTPTPACYNFGASTAHQDIIIGSCNGDERCKSDKCGGGDEKFDGSKKGTTHAYLMSTTGVSILYPPFNTVSIKYIKQREWYSGCDYVCSTTSNWYAGEIIVDLPDEALDGDNRYDDFGNWDNVRYASYMNDEGTPSIKPYANEITDWRAERLNYVAQNVKFNRVAIISDNLQPSNHVKTGVIKQIYYADADGSVDLTLSSAIGNGTVRAYCFAPTRGYLATGDFTTLDENMAGELNSDRKSYAAYDKVWGSTSSGAHSYRFRVADWKSAATRNSVNVVGDPSYPGMNVKKLSGGLEVYIVLLAGTDMDLPGNAYHGSAGKKITFYGKPRLLRTHVYPVKPKWRKDLFKNNYCISDAAIDLTEYVDMGTEVFNGRFEVVEGNSAILQDGKVLDFSKIAVNGNIANRQLIKIRCYPYWTENNDGLNPYMEFTTYVYPKPTLTVVNELEKVCSYETEFIPDRYSADLPGTFIYTGSYMKTGKLNAAEATAAGYTSSPITYTYTSTEGSCKVAETYTQLISKAPDLSDFVMSKNVFCFDETINLRECTSVTGGTFTGFGVNSDSETFSSAYAGIGSGDIYFNKTENGCKAEKKQTVSVRDLQAATVLFIKPPVMCSNDEPIYLPDYLTDSWASNGAFSGKGVESPRFYPDKAGTEFPKITYSYGLTGCKVTLSQELQVKTPATLTVSSIPAVCSTNEFDLSKHVNIKDGTYTGTSISGSSFAPIGAGIGSHPIGYSVKDVNGCQLSTSFNVVVNDLLADDVTFEGIPEQCGSDAGYLDLRFYVKGHTSGTFSGKGVENFRFYPAQASLGFNTLTYTYGNGSCRRTIQTEVYVTAVPAVIFEKFDRVCDNDPIKLMDYVSPKGGTFTGTGVTDNVFYPTQAGLGTHEIAYATAIGTCTITGKSYINVVGLSDNDASFRTLPEVCITDDGYLDLRGYLVNAPDNGTFTGTGVEGFRYYPANGKVGFSTITYSFTSGNCPKTIRAEVFVRNVPAVSFRAIPAICTTTTIDLMNYVSTKGGTFTGNGVLGSTFYAEAAGIGKHEITYRVSSNGCASVAKVTIDVADLLDENIAFSTIAPVCKSDSNWLDLRTYINHSGGTFSGQGVDNYRFYPSRANEGYVLLAYSYGSGSCKRTAYTEVLVQAKPTVSMSTLPVLCESSAEVNLMNYVNPKGGTFSGVGVSAGVFSAAIAQVGKHTIYYAYTDGNGCKNSASSTIEVSNNYSATVTFGGLPEVCATDGGYYELNSYVQGHTGGTFSGQGVSNGRFYPAQARVGFNTLTYTYGNGVCQKVLKADVNVLAVATTRPIALAKVCSNEPILLMEHVNNKGGEFSGNGVQGNVFHPTYAGYGVHDITYQVAIDNCLSSASLQAEVLSVATPPTFEAIPTQCKSDSGYIDLREYILNYQEGTFSGQGVESYRFYPTKAKDGFNTLTYTYGSSSCQRSLKTEVYITPKPELLLTPFSRICETDTVALEAHANILGGAWSGKGVFGNSFIAEQAGTGVHTLTYSATQGMCTVSEVVSIEVASLLPKVVTFDTLPVACAQDVNFLTLTDYVHGHTGGAFIGNGVSNGRFYPAQAKEGYNTITYTYGSGACTYNIKSEAKILPVPTTSVVAVGKVCTNQPVALMSHVNNKGGVFSGTGVVRDTFYPENAGIGAHTIAYQVLLDGCVSRAELPLEVLSVAATPVFSELPTLCKSDSGYIDLRQYVLNYQDGTFSGQGVENYRFYPIRAKDGFNTLTYTYGSSSCQRSLKTEAYVTPKAELLLAPFSRICEADTVALEVHANILGGAWSGKGVFGNTFIAEQAGVGTHPLTYSATQGMCKVSGTVSIEVASLLPKVVTFDTLPVACAQDVNFLTLTDYVHGHTGGAFIGNGVSNGRFYPAQAKEGYNTITYTYGSGACTYNIKSEAKILPVPTTSVVAVGKVCTNQPVALMSHVNNKGGAFSGTGVVRDTFYPENAGIGAHTIAYQVLLDGCVSRAELPLEVLSVAATPVFSELPVLCKSDSGYIDLRQYVLNYQDGTFSGQGVENYRFYPIRAKDGFNTLTYTYGSSSCQRSLKTEAYVTPKAELLLAPFSRICEADTVALETHTNILGGAWSGKGVFGNSFIAEQAGTGVHTLTYSATQGMCTVSEVVSIEVASLLPKVVNFTTPSKMCIQDLGFITLADYVQGHTGGTFSGTGVSNGRFYPAQAKVGFNTVTYIYGSGSCQRTLKTEVEVTNSSATKVTIAPLPKFCKADTINLLYYASAKGGVFTGAGVVGDTLFLSEHAGVGTHELVYQVNLGGCNSYTSASATVLSLNRTDIRFKTHLPDFCSTQSEAVDLFDLVENSRDGSFSGKGVEQGRYFYPNKVGTEVSTITYTYGTGSCEQKVSADLKIYTAPNKGSIDIDDVLALCGGTLDLGAMVEPKGGMFSGSHISAEGVFDGNAAPLGETEVVYSVANKGCKLTKSILIKNEPAQTFDFSVDVTTVAEGGKIRFVPEKSSMTSYTWHFGDGAYSREVSPWHYYYHNGDFDVRLEVQNQLGCILSTTKSKLISVGNDLQGRYVQAAGMRYYMDELTPGTEELSAVESATGCASLEVVVFPNPVSNGTLNISRVECVERVEVYDLGMSLLLAVDAPTGSVSVGALRPGMYLVTLKLVDGGLKVGKILIR